MGAREFGRVVDRYMHERGWTQTLLAYKLSRPPHHIWNETMVRRLRLGQRHVDHALVARVIEVFELGEADAAEAWHAAGLWPPELTVDELRRLHTTTTTPKPESTEPEVAESAGVAGDQSGTQRKGSPTQFPAVTSRRLARLAS